MKEKRVVAKVNEKEITQDDVMKFLNDIGPQVAMQFQSPEGIQKVIDELVNQELLYLDAEKNNLDKDQEFQDVLKQNEEILLKNYALNRLIQDVEANEEEVKEYFEEHRDQFKMPRKAKASHILVGTEEEAKDILEKIDEGMSFEEAAKEYSTCPSKEQGGDLGEFNEGQMVPEFEEAVFSMEEGSISEPVKTQHGFHIIKLVQKSDEINTEFKDVKEDVHQHVIRLKQQERYTKKINDLKEKNKVEIM